MEKEFNLVKSVYESNFEVIKNIMDLYKIERFDLDCTYSTGNFWKGLPSPVNKTDLFPINDSVTHADSEHLPFEDNSMKSIMYDPPFVIVGKTFKENKEGSSVISKRFSGYTKYDHLKNNYYNTIKELYRITDGGGFVVIKCQDTVSGGKNHFSHVMVMNMALELGFYPKDLFILTAKMRINSFGGRWNKQEHARKYHSYFWVFEKIKQKVNYTYPVIKQGFEVSQDKG